VRSSGAVDAVKDSPALYIIDARPSLNAYGNALKGKGFENVEKVLTAPSRPCSLTARTVAIALAHTLSLTARRERQGAHQIHEHRQYPCDARLDPVAVEGDTR
jgi:hypothetical protein